MTVTGIVADPVFKNHDTGPGHPETPERLDGIYSALESAGLMKEAERIPLREASQEELLAVHTKGHIERIKATAGRDRSWMDGDTPTSKESYQTALLAAGSLLNATAAVMEGKVENALALVRPPGHHAEKERAMGFCLFNNVAVAAHYARKEFGAKRVLIVDWDVHHGNGTQNAFYADPRVLYFSSHRFPFYPGTGGMDETGSAEGKGYNVNVPLPAGCGDPEYDAVYKRVLSPVARAFNPDLVLVSAGFDVHRLDPLGGMNLSEEGFARVAGEVMALAKELAGGRLVITLEGGYHIEGQAAAVAEVTRLMMGKTSPPQGDLDPDPAIEKIIEKADERLGDKWPGIGSEN